MSSGPCICHERRDRRLSEVPSSKPIDRLLSPRCGKGLGNDGLVSEHAEHFHVEVFRYPQLGVARQEPCKRTPPLGGRQHLDAGRSVDHDAGQRGASRSSRSISAARSDSGVDSSGAARISSIMRRPAAAEQSSSGFTTTMVGPRSSARRATREGYRRERLTYRHRRLHRGLAHRGSRARSSRLRPRGRGGVWAAAGAWHDVFGIEPHDPLEASEGLVTDPNRG